MAKDRSYTTAIHILTTLAYHDPQLLSSESLAQGLKTNPAFVRRILCRLAQNGLVQTEKGKFGGNRLARPANRINLKEVYQAINAGPLFGTFEKEPHKPCPVSCRIGGVLKRVYGELDRDLKKEMEKFLLSQIVKEVARSA